MRGVKGSSPHGSSSRYIRGCRCKPCCDAGQKYARDLQQRPHIRAKRLERTNAIYSFRRKEIQRLKIARGCIDCGYRKHPAALHFDHTRGIKTFNIAQIMRHSWEQLLLEIEKCEVRCANCHAERSWKAQK